MTKEKKEKKRSIERKQHIYTQLIDVWQIKGGCKADYFVTAVRTGEAGYGGISLLIIPRTQGVFTTELPLQGHGCSKTACLVALCLYVCVCVWFYLLFAVCKSGFFVKYLWNKQTNNKYYKIKINTKKNRRCIP